MTIAKGRLLLAMRGHAHTAQTGADPVCAACSILAATLCEMLEVGAAQQAFCAPPVTHLAHGDAYLACVPVAARYEEFLHAYYMAEVGFTLLQREYPQSIHLEVYEEASRGKHSRPTRRKGKA